MSAPVILVDGCRSTDEVDAFRSLADVTVIAVTSSPEARYERLVKRGRSDAPANIEEFIKRDEREIGWGLAKAIALADVTVTNESTLEEFRVSSRKALERLL
jgi:dephospho-CoA kinase